MLPCILRECGGVIDKQGHRQHDGDNTRKPGTHRIPHYTERTPVIGTTIQHYRITDRLGSGGMGEVYKADDLRLGRPVALKFLPPELKADPESRARLLNEARAASMLRSPNIAVTYDIGESDGSDFIVMEYVEGELLSTRLGQGPLPLREAVEAGIQIADALDE